MFFPTGVDRFCADLSQQVLVGETKLKIELGESNEIFELGGHGYKSHFLGNMM